jgi:hypothetical protein
LKREAFRFQVSGFRVWRFWVQRFRVKGSGLRASGGEKAINPERGFRTDNPISKISSPRGRQSVLFSKYA